MGYDLSEGKQEAVQRMFTAIARRYDLNNTILSFGLHHFWKRAAVCWAQIRAGEKIADIGAGTLDLSLLAAKRAGTDGAVIALDLNEAMLKRGRSKGGAISLLLGNAEALPLKEGSIDAALTGFCIRNLADPRQGFEEILRILKPGGRVVCLDFSRPTRAWLRRIYDLYSFTLLPRIGRAIARDSTGVYHYLPDSIRRFPDQERLAEMMRASGFHQVEYRNLSGGIVALHRGVRV